MSDSVHRPNPRGNVNAAPGAGPDTVGAELLHSLVGQSTLFIVLPPRIGPGGEGGGLEKLRGMGLHGYPQQPGNSAHRCPLVLPLGVPPMPAPAMLHTRSVRRLWRVLTRPLLSVADTLPPPPLAGVRGLVRGQEKVCVPKIGLKFPALLINVIFCRRIFFLMWVGGLVGAGQGPKHPPSPGVITQWPGSRCSPLLMWEM